MGLYIVPHIDLNKSIYILMVSMLVYTFIYFGLQRVINFNAYEKQLTDSVLVKLRLKKG